MTTLRSRRSQPTSTSFAVPLKSRYSEQVTATVLTGEAVFKVFRGYEGTQIVINWSLPSEGIIKYRLLRRWLAWPENIENGVLLVEDEEPFSIFTYSDRNIEPYQVYYYQLFMLRADGVWLMDKKMRGKTFSYPTGYFENKLWELLPEVYRAEDGEA